MTTERPDIECDLIVIGSGMAGMAASLFAAQRGVATIQVGITGEINFASGLLDLLGVHPVESGRVLEDPWEGLQQLKTDQPRHPYARLPTGTIRSSMQAFLDFLASAGLPYVCRPDRNTRVVTPVGTVKTTYAVPLTMSPGADALAARRPALLVDFQGLKGYSALQLRETLAPAWPGLKTVRIPFPDLTGDLYAERMARALQAPGNRERLAEAVMPHIGGRQAVGFPAVLGVYRPQEVAADLSARLGVPVFEIPTMLPAVTGLRLRETFENHLPAMGVQTFYQQRVVSARRLADGRFRLELQNAPDGRGVLARGVLLASGRFFGRGLAADRGGIRETLLNLPVHQPASRSDWHSKNLLDRPGHAVNRSGLETDDRFRPVDRSAKPVFPNLAAAGSVLAHQDWIRQKCGSGLSITTAYGAVKSLIAGLDGG
jgi:glycerol-3-phosphate dehydrogenase subunit B